MTARTLALLLALTACDDGADGVDDKDPSDSSDTETDGGSDGWTLVSEDLPAGLLSVTGTGPDDVWVVGADAGDGPTVLNWDGSAWSRIDTGTTQDLWWGFVPDQTEAWFVGNGGRVVRYDRTADTATQEVLDANVSLFGIWGPGDGTLWTVGGDIRSSSDGAAVFRYDGTTWTEVTLPADAADDIAVYKVWGSAADDVWFCGVNGLTMHWDGTEFTTYDTGVTATLFTVNGTGPDDVYMVGGLGNGVIQHWDGTDWTLESPDFASAFNGVFATGDGVWAVGRQGGIWTSAGDGAWEQDPRGIVSPRDFHAAWQDGAGGLWAVGGKISSSPLELGMIVYGGPNPPAGYAP